MTTRLEAPIASHVFVCEGDQLLLMRRAGTTYADGMLSVPAGHVHCGETAQVAAARELREEVGVAVPPRELNFALVQQKLDLDGQERVDFFFSLQTSEPVRAKICEPSKCSELVWVPLIATFQTDLVPYVAAALDAWRDGRPIAFFGYK